VELVRPRHGDDLAVRDAAGLRGAGGPVTAGLATAIPVEGGYYQWVKRAWGNFAGYEEGMLNWVDSWVDMALYPVLFSSYLGFIWSKANPGADVFGQVAIPGVGLFQVDMYWVLGVVCVVFLITALNIFGAKVVGDTSTSRSRWNCRP
jgi:amino acid transporter